MNPKEYLRANATAEWRLLVEQCIERSVVTLDGCLEWQGALCEGYGVVSRGRKNIGLHRLALLATEALPPGQCALHICDNRKCWNPKHLFAGTKAHNAQDAVRKGRWTRQKLSESDVLDIRRRIEAGEKQRQIAALYSVHESHVARIKGGYIWAGVRP